MELFQQLKSNQLGVRPNSVTYNILMSACLAKDKPQHVSGYGAFQDLGSSCSGNHCHSLFGVRSSGSHNVWFVYRTVTVVYYLRCKAHLPTCNFLLLCLFMTRLLARQCRHLTSGPDTSRIPRRCNANWGPSTPGGGHEWGT